MNNRNSGLSLRSCSQLVGVRAGLPVVMGFRRTGGLDCWDSGGGTNIRRFNAATEGGRANQTVNAFGDPMGEPVMGHRDK